MTLFRKSAVSAGNTPSATVGVTESKLAAEKTVTPFVSPGISSLQVHNAQRTLLQTAHDPASNGLMYLLNVTDLQFQVHDSLMPSPRCILTT